MEIISFIIAYLGIVFVIDSYVKNHLEKDDREFRLTLALFLKRNYFYLGYTKLLKRLLSFTDKLYDDVLSLNAVGTSIIIAILYSTFTILLMWLISGNGVIASIQILPSIESFIERGTYLLLMIFLYLAMGIFTSLLLITSIYFKGEFYRYNYEKKNKNKLAFFKTDEKFKDFFDSHKKTRIFFTIYDFLSSFISVTLFLVSTLLFPLILFSTSSESIYTVLVFITSIVIVANRPNWYQGEGVIVSFPFVGFIVGMIFGYFSSIGCLEGGLLGSGALSLVFLLMGTRSQPGGNRVIMYILFILFISFILIAFLESKYISPYNEIQFIKNIIETYVYPNVNSIATIQTSLPIIFFLVLIPIVNGFWDWLSIGISRVLGLEVLKTIESDEKYILIYIKFFIYALIDIALAIIILILLVSTLTILISLINTVIHFYGLPNIIDINSIWDGVINRPTSADSIWIIFLLVSTLIPTFLHIFIMSISLFSFNFKDKFKSKELIKGLRKQKVGDSTIRKTSFYLSIVFPLSLLLSIVFIYSLFNITKYSFEKTSVSLTEYSKEVYIKSNIYFEKKIENIEFFSKSIYLEVIENANKDIKNEDYTKALNHLNNFLDNNKTNIKKSHLSQLYILIGKSNLGLHKYQDSYLYFNLAFISLKSFCDDRFDFDFLLSSSEGKEIDLQKLKQFYHMMYYLILLSEKIENDKDLLNYLTYVNNISEKYLEEKDKNKSYIYFHLSKLSFLLKNKIKLNKYSSFLLNSISLNAIEKNFSENYVTVY